MVDSKSPKKSSAVKRRLAFNADHKFLGTSSKRVIFLFGIFCQLFSRWVWIVDPVGEALFSSLEFSFACFNLEVSALIDVL